MANNLDPEPKVFEPPRILNLHNHNSTDIVVAGVNGQLNILMVFAELQKLTAVVGVQDDVEVH